MKPVESTLHPIDGYLISITRDPENGWYVLEIGLPASWVYDENNKIGCATTEEYEQGKIIKIFPKKKEVVIDDLIAFVGVIIRTNEKIAAKEKEFTNSLEEKKKDLENWAKGFYKEMDDLKEESFKKVGKEFAASLDKPKAPRKPRAPRKPKAEIGEGTVTTKKAVSTTTVSEDTETLD